MDAARGRMSILQLYPDHFRPRGFYPPPEGPGFSGAVVLCVETEVGPHCLRGWPPEVDTDRIAGLHRLLEHVRSRGIDFVAVPVRASDGRTLVSVARTPLAIGAVAPRAGRLLVAAERCAVDGGDDRARPPASGDGLFRADRRGNAVVRNPSERDSAQPSRNESSARRLDGECSRVVMDQD